MLEVQAAPRSPAFSLPIAAILLLASLSQASQGQAQEEASPQASFEGQTTTLIVEVPVEVTFEGEPVRGLSKDQFRLYDGRKEQDILGIEEIDLVRLDKEAAQDPLQLPVAARRHFLLLFDRTYARPAALLKARDAAERLVAHDLHPADLVGVATYGRSSGAELILGFTSDRSQVITALEALKNAESKLVSGDPLRLSIDSFAPDGQDGGGAAGGQRAIASAAMEEAARDLRDLQNRANRTERVAEIGVMTRSLGALAESLRGLDGRKHVVLFSQGFDDSLLTGTQDDQRREEMQRQVQDNAIWRVDSTEYFGSTEAFDQVDAMNEFFRRSGATVHTVDIGGLQAGGSATDIGVSGRGSSLARSGRGGLFMISDGTGGELFENFNDLGDAMGRLLEKTSVTYLLSFSPRKIDFDGSFHKLRVKVDGVPRRARISHRAGYYAPGSTSNGLETQLDLASRLLDDSRGAISVELHARGPDPGEPTPILVEVDAETFFAGRPDSQRGSENSDRAEIYVYAFTTEGRVAAHTARAAGLSPATLPAGEKTFTMQASLELPDGEYDLRVLVRNAATGKTGARLLPLELSPTMDIASTVERPATPAGGTAAQASAEAAAAQDEPALDAFAAAYGGILDRLGDRSGLRDGHDFDELVAELAKAEVTALGDRGERGVGRIERIQSKLSKERGDLRSQLVLHHDLALRHRRQARMARQSSGHDPSRRAAAGQATAGRAWLEHLALTRARRLARELGTGHPSSRRLASAALASLGGALQAQGRRASRSFFAEAIEIDPANEAARLGLAADLEKRGGPWDEVTRHLEALITERPESREGRLRLAINLLRASQEKGAMAAREKQKKAADHFRELLGESDWIDALAAQELARLLIDKGRLKKAENVLTEALERHPGANQELRILLAFVLDRSRRSDAARRWLAQAPSAEEKSAQDEASQSAAVMPRARYNRWPSDALGEARALLRNTVAPSVETSAMTPMASGSPQ